MCAYNDQGMHHIMVCCQALAGLQVIKQLLAHHSTAAVILMGGSECRVSATRALQAGACDFVRKPVDLEELMARIERSVQRQVCCL